MGGGQKVRYVPRNQGDQTFFGGISPGIFCPDIPAVHEKFERKKTFLCSIFLASRNGPDDFAWKVPCPYFP